MKANTFKTTATIALYQSTRGSTDVVGFIAANKFSQDLAAWSNSNHLFSLMVSIGWESVQISCMILFSREVAVRDGVWDWGHLKGFLSYVSGAWSGRFQLLGLKQLQQLRHLSLSLWSFHIMSPAGSFWGARLLMLDQALKMHVPRGRARGRCFAFYDPVLKKMQRHFHCILLGEAVMKSSPTNQVLRDGNIDFTFLWRSINVTLQVDHLG